ncbi:hypothetical protein [Thalassobaculum litoreum]|uniref:Uncharacterized protein n=1 Tax=Thalassobaculum litoreum DSM 18839 TaxID=1123362 RepID=A0A8G2EY59_9PROT|nr:hypothetical protein [Thalassobaculum litoreum]SDF67880.1 hypothetical protein SAMN05660686_02032 [Thalassobaculum litoreum DSM 18839]
MTLTDPLIATLAVPVLVTVAVAVLLRLIGGAGTGARTAAFGIPVGLIVAVALLPGLAPTPPVTVMEKLVWLAAAGGLIGILIEMVTQTRFISALAAFFWPFLAVVWTSGIDVTAVISGETPAHQFPYRVFEVSAVAGLIVGRMHQIAEVELCAPVALIVIAAGLGAVGLATGPGYAWAIGLPLAAAGLGWVVCNWPNRRLPFGAPGEIGGSAVAIALAAVMVYQARVPVVLVLLVLSALAIEPLARRFVATNALTKSEAVRPIALAGILALPAALAVVLALYAPALIPDIYRP